MADHTTLTKANPLLPAEDYVAMRKAAFKAIEKLGHEHWTDYNNSDPGITMLEAVLYAITDLSYRTGFEIKDLLMPKTEQEDPWKQIFYTARQILHNSPLSITDYRKLIIDIDGIRNAWLQPSKEYEVPLWINYNYYEKRKDPGCGCADDTPETCFGKLSLDPATPKDLDTFKKAKEEALVLATAATKKKIEDTDKRIEVIEKELMAIGDEDLLKSAALRREKLQLEQGRKAAVRKLKELDEEKTMLTGLSFVAPKIVELEGLYNVLIEFEDNVPDEDRDDIRNQVQQRLMCHRNLGEDFLSVNAVEEEEFNIGVSIALEEYADPDEVLAKIFFIIYTYFSPSVPFFTIQQLLDKGYSIDEIFEGPALRHGFIEDKAIEKTDLFRDIRLSDIINEIADIKGVKAITYLHLPFVPDGNPSESRRYFAKWINALREQQKIARINPLTSAAIFCKASEVITYNVPDAKNRRPERMLKLFNDLKVAERRYKLNGVALDLPVPTGENMDVEDYYPVTFSLPMCYGVSDRAGLPADASPIRKAQALQLRGYLYFFEQLLSDHLVQLNHLRELFTMDDTVKHTLYAKPVEELLTEGQDILDLIVDYGKDDSANPEALLKDFAALLRRITENEQQFEHRRNRFLTHFLARFSEDMSEYDAINRWLMPKQAGRKAIQDKVNLLKDGEYYKISSNRGKGFDYTKPDFWDTRNVSGTERRVGRLLGFADITRRNLAPGNIIEEPVMELDSKKQPIQKNNKKGQPLNRIRFMNPKDPEQVLLTSVEVIEGCCTELLMAAIIEHGDQRKNFIFHDDLNRRARKSAGELGVFWFELWDGSDPATATLLANSERFTKKEDRDRAWRLLQQAIAAINANEGMHLVEHLLLRPKLDEVLDEANQNIAVSLLPVCLTPCDLGIGLDQATEIPKFRKQLRRVPAEKCYDNMPWILEYFRLDEVKQTYTNSLLFAETYPDDREVQALKFRYYKDLAARIGDIQEYGSDRQNYQILKAGPDDKGKIRVAFAIFDNEGRKLAQSPYSFYQRTDAEITSGKAIDNDVDEVIAALMYWLSYEMDWYCEADPCDNSEDPYSFRATIVLPCWPKRLRNPTFRHLVEKTIRAQSPVHLHCNIVWLGISEMRRFEQAYCGWLEEMAQTEIPGYEKTNPLVNVLSSLRPCGVCEEDCSDTVKENNSQITDNK
jgi:hypothetical protein